MRTYRSVWLDKPVSKIGAESDESTYGTYGTNSSIDNQLLAQFRKVIDELTFTYPAGCGDFIRSKSPHLYLTLQEIEDRLEAAWLRAISQNEITEEFRNSLEAWREINFVFITLFEKEFNRSEHKEYK